METDETKDNAEHAVDEPAEPLVAVESQQEQDETVTDQNSEEQPESDTETESKVEPAIDADAPVSWTASEYIHVEKNALWYILFTVIVIGLVALDIFILKSYTFSALVLVMAIALIIYSRRPPRTIQYTLSGAQGLYIGEKLYAFGDFKAFGVIKDGEHHSIMLLPTKRFAPGVSVYFPEESGEEIVDILGTRLPMQNFKLDLIDLVVRQLRL